MIAKDRTRGTWRGTYTCISGEGAYLSLDRVRVAVVEPRHEAWLCIGLGIDRGYV